MTDDVQVIVLNGGSSSGKSSLARALQQVLPGCWLHLGVDDLLDACPPVLRGAGGLDIGEGGHIDVGAAFTAVERHWMAGVAAMVRDGARVIVDDAFVSGPAAQQRWREALHGLVVRWVGVRLDADLAAAREAARGDRVLGMAARQADSVHVGIDYDLVVDTASGTPAELAARLAAQLPG